MNRVIRVLVVDDSPFVCRLLASYLQAAPDIEVVGMALNGLRAIEQARELRPDVVTLDLEMPQLDGLAVLERIMQATPVPVIVVSGVSRRAAQATLRALEMGAVDFILKYTPGTDIDPGVLRQEIVSRVRIASRVKVISNRLPGGERGQRRRPIAEAATAPGRGDAAFPAAVVVIGASTGGPMALRELLGHLPGDFPAPILVVQHMPAAFTPILAEQLDRQVPLRVREAKEGDRLVAGQVLVAPGEFHLLVRPDARIELLRGPRIGGHCPSIDVTMQSVAQTFGPRSKGIVLTGMGNDGTLGLVSIRARGGRTFAQESASCVVSSMPQQAIARGVVDHVASPREIALLLNSARHMVREVCHE